MPEPSIGPADATRILGLFPHPRHLGRVALDRWGLAPRSTTVFEVRRRGPLAERLAGTDELVARSVRRFRPALVVIASGPPEVAPFVEQAAAAARALCVRVEVRDVAPVAAVFAGSDVVGCDRLGQAVARSFFPELASSVPSWSPERGRETRRRLRPLWRATAAALVVLAERHPRIAAALAQGRVPPGLVSFIAKRERELHPAV